MKITNTFVTVAPDCNLAVAVVPMLKDTGPVHAVQYQLLTAQPYHFTHDELIYETHLLRNGLSRAVDKAQEAEIRATLFAKPQACMRASALPKKWGWGVHYDGQGKLAIFAIESWEYRQFVIGKAGNIKVVHALRSKKG